MQSMTGFGRSQKEKDGLRLEIEIKSVNHRFLDTVWRLPSVYSSFETALQKLVVEKLNRGRVEIYVSRSDARPQSYEVCFNEDLYKSYLNIGREALKIANVSTPEALTTVATSFMQKREVTELVPVTQGVDEEYDLIASGVAEALDELDKMRAVEGKALVADMEGYVSKLDTVVDVIQEKSAKTPDMFQDRLTARLAKLAPEGEIDPDRLAQEVAILADRTDVSEELTRLKSHISQYRKVLKGGSGRKLEFLIQEMGREVNTTGSKAQNSGVTEEVIECKAILEKLREQAANVE